MLIHLLTSLLSLNYGSTILQHQFLIYLLLKTTLFLCAPRPDGRRGGGVGILCHDSLCPKILSSNSFPSFESILISCKSPSFLLAVIYRPPKLSQSAFLDDFSDFLSDLTIKKSPIFIVGDFNIPKINQNSLVTSKFLDILSLFGLLQNVKSSTHINGNTLDLILSSTPLNSINFIDLPGISDHKQLNFSLPILFEKPLKSKITVTNRCFKNVNTSVLKSDISRLLPPIPELPTSPNSILDSISSALNSATDIHAPLKTKTFTPRDNYNKKWFNSDCRQAKRKLRSLERQFRKNTSTENFLTYKLELQTYLATLNSSRIEYNHNFTHENKTNLKSIFNFANSLCSPQSNSTIISTLTADDFSDYFYNKIIKIRSNIPNTSPCTILPESIPSKLSSFRLTSEEEVCKIIKTSKKTNTPIETFPSKFYSELLPEFLPYLVVLFNSSFTSGSVPDSFKQAIVRPLIKKPNLDSNDPSNFRPISLLPFLSKVLERLIYCRLTEHMNFIQLDEEFQSGFKCLHSTETALLYVTDRLRIASDNDEICILITLDLSSAFDTVDPSTLLDILHDHLGISDVALDWFRSYLSNRSQTILFNNKYSNPKFNPYGVPQGSVDGPLLFRIYLIPLLILLKRLGLKFHIYADDTQIYICCSSDVYPAKIEYLQSSYGQISGLLS